MLSKMTIYYKLQIPIKLYKNDIIFSGFFTYSSGFISRHVYMDDDCLGIVFGAHYQKNE